MRALVRIPLRREQIPAGCQRFIMIRQLLLLSGCITEDDLASLAIVLHPGACSRAACDI